MHLSQLTVREKNSSKQTNIEFEVGTEAMWQRPTHHPPYQPEGEQSTLIGEQNSTTLAKMTPFKFTLYFIFCWNLVHEQYYYDQSDQKNNSTEKQQYRTI